MAKINLSGETPQGYDKPLIEEDAYEATLDLRDDIVEVGNEKFGVKPKIIMTAKLNYLDQNIELPLFLNPNVVKGSGTYSDSKLYTILDKAGELEEFKKFFKDGEVADEEILTFLARLVGRKARVMVKNVDGMGGKYSTVKDIIKFIDREQKQEALI